MTAKKRPTADLIHEEDLAELTGLTTRRPRQLAAEGWFPAPVKGHYDRKAVLTGLFRYYRESNSRAKSALTEQQLAKSQAETELAQFELRQKRRAVVDAKEVEETWTGLLLEVRARWLQLPAKAKLAFPLWQSARDCGAWLESEARDILRELAGDPKPTPEPDEDE